MQLPAFPPELFRMDFCIVCVSYHILSSTVERNSKAFRIHSSCVSVCSRLSGVGMVMLICFKMWPHMMYCKSWFGETTFVTYPSMGKVLYSLQMNLLCEMRSFNTSEWQGINPCCSCLFRWMDNVHSKFWRKSVDFSCELQFQFLKSFINYSVFTSFCQFIEIHNYSPLSEPFFLVPGGKQSIIIPDVVVGYVFWSWWKIWHMCSTQGEISWMYVPKRDLLTWYLMKYETAVSCLAPT